MQPFRFGVASAILFSLVGTLPAATTDERVLGAGKLWVTIQYFHPWIGYRNIDWEKAWVTAYPRIRSAEDQGSYERAIEELLAPLGDKTTHVARKDDRKPPATGDIQTKPMPDSILLVTVPASEDWQGMIAQLRKLRDEVKKSNNVVFDLRDASQVFAFALGASGLEEDLVTEPVTAPGERRRFHSGLVSESGTSGGYYSGSQISDGARFGTTRSTEGHRMKSAFVITRRTAVPAVALALQAADWRPSSARER